MVAVTFTLRTQDGDTTLEPVVVAGEQNSATICNAGRLAFGPTFQARRTGLGGYQSETFAGVILVEMENA